MKQTILGILIAVAGITSAQAQTLRVDPIYVGGTAYFEVHNGTPAATAIICYSRSGSGPFTLSNGLVLDLSMPIKHLNPFILDALGSGDLGPFPVPNSAVANMQLWFQGVQLDMWANPIYSVTNMVPMTVLQSNNYPPYAADDNSSVTLDTPVVIDALANDWDPDGDAISLVAVLPPTYGTALIVSGQIEYTPLAGYVGADLFTYVITDGLHQATGTVFLDVASGLAVWGKDLVPSSSPPSGNDFTHVSVGAGAATVVKSDGSLVSWGTDTYGQVTDTPVGNDFTQTSVGEWHSIALKSDGSLVSWGADTYGQVTDTPVGNDFTQVAGGLFHSVALKSDGSLMSWGWDFYGQVSNTPTTNDFVQVAAGYGHSVALKSDGSLASWGDDFYGQVSNTPGGNDFTQVAVGDDYSVAVKSDGSLASWGSDSSGQVSNTPGGNDFTQVAGGFGHSVALKSDGSLVSWGYDAYGQVTDTPTSNDFIQVAVGGLWSVAIKQ
jgi:hypothetical protein